MIGPGIFTLTFSLFIGVLKPLNVPGAPWLLAAVLLLAAIALTLKVAGRDSQAAAAA